VVLQLISPAKSLEFEKDIPTEKTTTPFFEKEAFLYQFCFKRPISQGFRKTDAYFRCFGIIKLG
jgi:hypothetical protein